MLTLRQSVRVLSVSFEAGTLIGGRYRLERPLGEGAVGLVWRAESSLFGQVAVKLLRPELTRDEEAVRRFAAEASAAATISHPNVVAIYDVGATQEQVPFFVMELCDGETLDVTIGSRGAVGVDYACELVSQVLAALEAAHALKIVHRDLKPGNIMVVHPEPDVPLVKVLDFGIACRVDSSEASESGKIFGTPNYMAPEQISGGAVDERTDIYAAGAILFELLTGRPPFLGRTSAEVMTHVMLHPPKPLRAYDRTLPAALETLLRSCLAKDPAQRPQTAHELGRAVRQFVVPRRRRAGGGHRERRGSLPVPLVRRSGDGEPVVTQIPLDAPVASEPVALPLVKRTKGDGPVSSRRAVLELVGEPSVPDDDDDSSES